MTEMHEELLVVKAALAAAKASSGILEDRICAFLRSLRLPAPIKLGQYGLYNTQLLAAEIEQIGRSDSNM